MQHGVGQSGKAMQAGRPIQIANDLGHAERGKLGVGLPYERIDTPAAR